MEDSVAPDGLAIPEKEKWEKKEPPHIGAFMIQPLWFGGTATELQDTKAPGELH